MSTHFNMKKDFREVTPVTVFNDYAPDYLISTGWTVDYALLDLIKIKYLIQSTISNKLKHQSKDLFMYLAESENSPPSVLIWTIFIYINWNARCLLHSKKRISEKYRVDGGLCIIRFDKNKEIWNSFSHTRPVMKDLKLYLLVSRLWQQPLQLGTLSSGCSQGSPVLEY